MKKTLLILSFLSLATILKSQQKEDTNSKDFHFESKEVIISTDKKMMTYVGDVFFKTEKLEIKAGKIEFDNKTNTITAYNFESFTFDGAITIPDSDKNSNTFVYTLGQSFAYIK